MPRPFGPSAIDRLGERLASDRHTPEDLERFDELRMYYFGLGELAAAQIQRGTFIAPTWRLKDRDHTLYKVRRLRTRLSTMQDLVGLRMPSDDVATLAQQDALVTAVCSCFESSVVVDRRVRPSHGYRAVHVIAKVDGCDVEVQIRTRLQGLWAQTIDKLADHFGREVRYGQVPAVTDPAKETAVRDLLSAAAAASSSLGDLEQQERHLSQAEDAQGRLRMMGATQAHKVAALDPELASLRERLDRRRETLTRAFEELRSHAHRLGGAA